MTDTPAPMSADELRSLRNTMGGLADPRGAALRPGEERLDTGERPQSDRAAAWASTVAAMDHDEMAELLEGTVRSFPSPRQELLHRVAGAPQAYAKLQPAPGPAAQAEKPVADSERPVTGSRVQNGTESRTNQL